MGRVTVLAVSVTIFLVLSGWCSGDLNSAYEEVLRRLEDPAVKLVAPGEVDPKYRNVTVEVYLTRILELNANKGYLDAIFWRNEFYTHPSLTFDAPDTDSLVLPASKVWIPDFEVFNSLGEEEFLLATNNVAVVPDGRVSRFPAVKQRIPCSPEDNNNTVTCSLKLGSWVYRETVLNTVLKSTGVNLMAFTPDPHWSLLDTSAEIKPIQYKLGDVMQTYLYALYEMTFQRSNNHCHK